MEARNSQQITETFRQIAGVALADPNVARQVREALVESGILGVFGVGAAFDVIDLLDTSGAEGLRAYLREMSLAQLREVVQARNYDPAKTSARWRSVNKFVELIIAHAQQELAEDQAAAGVQSPALAAASWML